MEKCHERWFDAPMLNRGKWREACGVSEDTPIWLEIGCGKGKFCTEMALRHPEVLYIAMERDASVTLAAIEKAHELEIPNLFFIRGDAGIIENYFAENEVNRIFLNFSDPWTRQNKPKRRLTYRDFLNKYKFMMREGGAIEFKTEGFILGVGAKMFTIAGPVIVYGVSASVVYGLIYWITTLY